MHEEPREALESALFEIKRVIIGQDAMLERVMVALLTGGHVLLEGVPGLAKTLTIKTLASVVGGTFSRIQFTPDLVPSDLVGTRIYRPDSGRFDTELGPVFANFLLADEINRAPAKVQSALLEVMQEQQVTIGGETHLVPLPFLVLATQNPIESEGTYPLPEAQVDRFLMKILVDYPSPGDEAAVVTRSLDPAAVVEERLSIAEPAALPRGRRGGDRGPRGDRLRGRARRRHAPAGRYGLTDVEALLSYGASPRGPIGLVQAARSLALLRGRAPRAGERRARPRARGAAPPARAQLRGPQRGHAPRRPARADHGGRARARPEAARSGGRGGVTPAARGGAAASRVRADRRAGRRPRRHVRAPPAAGAARAAGPVRARSSRRSTSRSCAGRAA